MGKLYGYKLEEHQKFSLDCKFHELWSIGGTIRPKNFSELKSDPLIRWYNDRILKGVYTTFDSNGKLVRCGISDDMGFTMKNFTPWMNEMYYEYHVSDLYTTIQSLREFKQHLKRLKNVSFLSRKRLIFLIFHYLR